MTAKSSTYSKLDEAPSLWDGGPTSGSEVGLRFLAAIERLPSRKDAAQSIRLSTDQISRIIRGESSPRLETVAALAEAAGVSANWLVIGEEETPEDCDASVWAIDALYSFTKQTGDIPERLVKDIASLAPSADSAEYIGKLDQLRSIIIEKKALIKQRDQLLQKLVSAGEPLPVRAPAPPLGDEFVMVARYDVRAAAGAGAVAETAEMLGYLAFRQDWIRNRLRRDPKSLLAIENSGDSMHPTIADGDILLIDTAESTIRTQAIYALVIAGLLVVKRVLLTRKGQLLLHSDNPDYGTEDIDPGEIENLRVVGRVVWHGGMI